MRGKVYFAKLNQKSGAGAVFFAPWSRSRSKNIPGAGAAWENNQEPEPLDKKVKTGAGAAKKLAGSPALHIMIIYHTPPSPLSRHIYYMYE